jgi:hypothetical protein
MDAANRIPSERHYRFHLWRMALGLAFSLALGVGIIMVLVSPGMQTAVVGTAGMAILTMVSGGTGFFASYLIYSRQPSDG